MSNTVPTFLPQHALLGNLCQDALHLPICLPVLEVFICYVFSSLIQMVPSLKWFDLQCFDLTMVESSTYSVLCISNFGFSSFPGLAILCHDARRWWCSQPPVIHKIARETTGVLRCKTACIFDLHCFQLMMGLSGCKLIES